MDYRDLREERFDAVASIGMVEHVGEGQIDEYAARISAVLEPGGRVLNHGITYVPATKRGVHIGGDFSNRYVFPDGELHEMGTVVSAMQKAGFEVRHVESLREHYALTLRAWVANLEADWDAAVADVGLARARIWRLYMAGSAVNFEAGHTQIHQVVATRSDGGQSGMPLRPSF